MNAVEIEMWNGSGSTTQPRTIIGIVADVKLQNLSDNSIPAVYWPMAQVPSDSALYVAVRTSGDPSGLLQGIRAQLHEIDKDLPMYAVESLDQSVSQLLSEFFSKFHT